MNPTLEKILDKLQHWWDLIVDMLPNFVLAVIMVVVFGFLGKLVKKLTIRVLSKTYKNKELTLIISRLAQLSVIVAGAMIALSVLNLDKTVTSLLAGAGIIGLALSFAFQDIAANLISGFFMAAKNPFETGDVVKVKDVIGYVKALQLRSTIIETFDGQEVRVPNRILFENPLKNYYRRMDTMVQLAVGVSYGEDLQKVEDVSKKAVSSVPGLMKDRPIQVIFTEFGDSSINLQIRYWITYEDYFHFLKGTSDGIKAVKSAYDKEGIMIPFPIRTLDFGIKGVKN